MKPVQLFCGFDERESAGFHCFASSVIRRSTRPVSIHPMHSYGLPTGSNSFTLSRFVVPALMDFKGHAIFCDASDMLCLSDIAKLDELFDDRYAVQCVQHPEYLSQHESKYIGTDMECAQSNYSRKNWASVMVMNCAHVAWKGVNPDVICELPSLHFLQFQNLLDTEIGRLPPEWNVLVDEGQDSSNAKILHWSNGIPSFKQYRNARHSLDWFQEFEIMTEGLQDG